jgi:hypothetical protein
MKKVFTSIFCISIFLLIFMGCASVNQSEKNICEESGGTYSQGFGETAGALAKNNEADLKDGIGDSLVTLIILARQCGFSAKECLGEAYSVIKNRKGKTVNGVFIKE